MNGRLTSNHLTIYDVLIKNVTVEISYNPGLNSTNSTASNITISTNMTSGWAATIYGDTSFQQMNISAGFQYGNDALGRAQITAYILIKHGPLMFLIWYSLHLRLRNLDILGAKVNADLLYKKDANVTVLEGKGAVSIPNIGTNNATLVTNVYPFLFCSCCIETYFNFL